MLPGLVALVRAPGRDVRASGGYAEQTAGGGVAGDPCNSIEGVTMFRTIRRWLARADRPAAPGFAQRRLSIEPLEARAAASSLLGLGLNNNTLYRFDTASPGTVSATTAI